MTCTCIAFALLQLQRRHSIKFVVFLLVLSQVVAGSRKLQLKGSVFDKLNECIVSQQDCLVTHLPF